MPLFQFLKNSDSEKIKTESAISSITVAPFWENLHKSEEYAHSTRAAQKEYLRFIAEVVKQDLAIQAASGLLACDTRHSSSYFPIGNLASGEAQVPFEGNTVVSHAYYRKRYFSAILDIAREGFLPQKNYTTGFYLPEWKLILIHNGIHHSAVASMLKKKGEATCKIVYERDVLAQINLSDNLQHWLLPDGKKIPVEEPRFALLYLIAKELAGEMP